MTTPEKPLNGIAVQREDYGTISGHSSTDGETVHILREDPLDQDSSDDDGFRMKDMGKYNPQLDKGNFFRDGIRKIDFVLVYEETVDKKEKKKKEADPTQKIELTQEERHRLWRQKFMKNIHKVGVESEEEVVQSDKKLIYYIKLYAPWDVMCFYAEDLCMRAPLQAHPNPSSNWSGKILKALHLPNIMHDQVPNEPLDYYTCAFKKSKLDRFLGSDNHDTYFSNTQRHRVLWEILSSTVYGKRKRAEIGIERLLEEDVYQAAYPLHDGPYEKPKHYVNESCFNPRQILHTYWARWGTWYKYQPLDHVREYFGEKIGIYFAWLGFYTAWLLPASIVGVLVFAYGLITINTNTVSNEVCNSGGDFLMCPLCDFCAYWNLSDVCLYTKVAYLFDHPGTVFYAVFMSFWAVTFLEYWKRKNSSLAHHWDCADFEEEEERPRPEYTALCTTYEKNPITGVNEPHFSQRARLPRIVSGFAAIIIMMVIVMIFIVAVIIYRVLISIPLFQNEIFRPRAQMIASMSSAVVNLILIMSMGKVYSKLAYKLTQWEMHRTQTEFEDQLTFKVFIFQFVNFYSSIFYVGFIKGKFVGIPGDYNKIFGLRNEDCSNAGCLIELAQQLGVIMIGKQIINNIQEVAVPKLKAWIHQRHLGSAKNVQKTRWEEDYELIENEGLFEEYLEMVLQFGFITIFVAAFPLAPLFALLNNWIEIRLDAQKFITETRRPVAERAQDIGVWFTILESLAHLAVISNAFLIAFTSEFLPKILYKYQYDMDLHGYTNFTLATSPPGTTEFECRYRDFRDKDGSRSMFYWHLLAVRLGFVIVFEHFVFGVCKLIDILVPDVPESVELKIKRERYLAKQALADTDAILMLARKEDAEGIEEATKDSLAVPNATV